MKRLTLAVVIALVVCICGCATTNSTSTMMSNFPRVRLPELKITIPDEGIPRDIASLSGKWGDSWYNSSWPGRLDAILVFEKISVNEAVVVYAIGDPPSEWGPTVGRGDWIRCSAKISIEQGRVKVSMPSPSGKGYMEFFLKGEILEGRLYRGGGMNYNEIKMKRLL